ncbi:Transposase [Methanosarcina vacuolata Z-761]|uniref:Transposase n=1 Tax=Methanosarcina vacuolata Z-761 TaxID=1434123 RepID=A0A0E3Q3D0_9EURY|nr:Transposase [Methanosarcina vacuolata Z-761]
MVKIKLKDNEEQYLQDFVKKGQKNARELIRARILLLANKNKKNLEIAEILNVGRNTVGRTKKRYLEEGLQRALQDNPRTGQPIKYTEKHIAEIIAQACTTPPDGRNKWTLALLTEELQKKEGFETINKESIRLVLKKAKLSPGRRESGASKI